MPVNPIVENTFKVVQRINESASGDDFINVFGVHNPDAGGMVTSTLDAIDAAVFDSWDTHLKAAMHTSLVFAEVQITNLHDAIPQQATYGHNTPGTSVVASLPHQVAAGVTWRTGAIGRSFRGRSFLGPFTEDFSAGRAVSAGLITALGDWATKLRADLQAAGAQLVVISRYHELVPRVTNITTDVESHLVRSTWKTQRRRSR